MDATLGNPGYDVRHYDLDLRFDPDGRVLDAVVTLSATMTADLDTVNVDLIGFDVEDVAVDGEDAAFARTERDITVRPRQLLVAGQEFSLAVRYRGTPQPFSSASGFPAPIGWRVSASGTEYVVSGADGARSWFPANDHPSDKASFTFRIKVPEPLTVAANGVLVDTVATAGGTTWTWEMGDPMAPYLATVVIGDYVIVDDVEATAIAGVPVRNMLPRDFEETSDPVWRESLARQGEMIAFLTERFGPYPFDAYGIAAVPGAPGGGLETQTLSILGTLLEGVVFHELAHQWFGNHVSVARWQDIWLGEGFATYATWLWQEHRGEATVSDLAAFEHDQQRALKLPPPADPPPSHLFNRSVYGRGALTLHALRLQIGDDAFSRTLRAWVDRYGGGGASTQDFVALAEEISASDLTSLFEAWLYADTMPDLPAGN
ncbi:MAG: M1 family metallopeptidase [Chloroflexi bacterium]|nr:M1 family metallopeptidase [Chloroflexota bacterium]